LSPAAAFRASVSDSALWYSAALVLLFATVGVVVVRQTDRVRAHEQREAASQVAAGAAFALERQIAHSLSATYALASVVRQHGRIDDFDAFAADTVSFYGCLASLQLAPGAVVSRIYPLAGNEAALGHDLLHDPDRRSQVLAAVESRQLTVAGPVTLKQGGVGLIGRLGVFRRDQSAPGGERFWGLVTAVVRLSDLLEAAQLGRLVEAGYVYQLTRVDPQTGAFLHIAGDFDLGVRDPVAFPVKVPNGEWALTVAPARGWSASRWLLAQYAMALLGALVLAALAFAVLRRTETLADRDRSLRARNRDLKQVLDNVGQGFLAIDSEGAVSPERSAIVDRWFGDMQPDEVVWNYLGLENEEFANRMQRAWKALVDISRPREANLAQMPSRLQRGNLTFDLAYRLVEAQGRIERVILVISDITTALAKERSERQMKAELQQAQKMEAVGRLAAGVAHEINTPIQYIGDNTRFVEEGFAAVSDLLRLNQEAIGAVPVPLDLQERLRQAAERADVEYLVAEVPKAISRTLDGVQRVATIVRAMKEFAHPDQKDMVATDLNRALLATLEIARNEYKYVADVQTDYAEIPLVTCHSGDLNQVFLNVIVNAAHAVEDAVKGTQRKGIIRVSTRQEGPNVVVAISDTGGGIPEAIRDKIFDPFFTTKEVGRGTGQGLAIAHNVVLKHHGSLTFTTRMGEGTTFFISVPVDRAAGKPERAA
jgi:signal transduction histidine kinase